MAATKADLIAEAEARGLDLTGDETVADLKALLEADDEQDSEAAPGVVDDAAEEAAEPREVLDPTKVIKLDRGGSGSYSVVDVPAGWNKDYRLLHGGKNYEHVDTDEDGVWCYRGM